MTSQPVRLSTALARREPRVSCVLADTDLDRVAATRRYLESRGIAVIGTPATVGELLVLVELHRPNVAVIDDQLEGFGGPSMARAVAERTSHTAIIVNTQGGDGEFLIEALEAGARGVLSRDAPRRDLVRSIEMVCDGRFSISVRLLGLLGDDVVARRVSQLDSREHAVLRLVVNGLRGTDLPGGFPGPADVRRELTRALAKLQPPRIEIARVETGVPEPEPAP
jgi:two-component system response regulator DesR